MYIQLRICVKHIQKELVPYAVASSFINFLSVKKHLNCHKIKQLHFSETALFYI